MPNLGEILAEFLRLVGLGAGASGSAWAEATFETASTCAIKFVVNRYTYRLEWSPYQEDYLGSCIEMPTLRRYAPTPHEALAEISSAVDRQVADIQALGETPPTPLTERSYSGTIVVRTSPELHGRLALEAAEQRVSMNQLVVQKLSGRNLPDGWGLSGLFD